MELVTEALEEVLEIHSPVPTVYRKKHQIHQNMCESLELLFTIKPVCPHFNRATLFVYLLVYFQYIFILS